MRKYTIAPSLLFPLRAKKEKKGKTAGKEIL